MANATVIHGPYGWYYPYKDENGKNKGLKLLDDAYEHYYKPGYLTDEHIASMLETEGKVIIFNIPKKNGSGQIAVSARVIPYVTKTGRSCKIIEFEPNKPNDKAMILANAEKIALSYWKDSRFDYTGPQKVIDSLDLVQTWKTFAQYSNPPTNGRSGYGTIKVYRPRSRKDDEIILYCKVENDNCTYLTEEQYKAEQAKEREKQQIERQEWENKMDAVKLIKDKLNKWIDSIVAIIWPGGGSVNNRQLIVNAEPIVANITVANLNDRLVGYLNSTSISKSGLSQIIESAKDSIRYDINTSTCQDTSIQEKFKSKLLANIKTYIEYLKIIIFRDDMYSQYLKEGLESMTSSVNIDTALDLGYFPTVQRILVKYKQESPKYIIYNMYRDILDLADLKDKLLNMLKIFYDFYDMPEKDRKSIAKFIAVNKLSDYYDMVSVFDDVLEILIDNSRDPKLTKPLLESIAGTSRANVLKDKTYYFEKRGRIRSNVLVWKPIELLERLRTLIKEFNGSSGVAVLTNIELDNDQSFIFQFYTFADAEGDEAGFDGRRMLNLTRIYNRNYPNERIGFNFNNDDSDDE